MLSIALLGFAVLAVALGVRTGIRASETPHPIIGVLAAIASYGVFTTLIAVSSGNGVGDRVAAAGDRVARPSIYAAGVVVGVLGVFGRGVHTTDATSRSAKEPRRRLGWVASPAWAAPSVNVFSICRARPARDR